MVRSMLDNLLILKKRIKEHFWKSTCQKDISYNSILHQAIRKYGAENFSWEVIEECEISEIDEKEIFYIKNFNTLSPNGYNILQGGQRKRVDPKRCEVCGIVIDRASTRCVKCSHLLQYACEHPSREELKQLIRTMPFTQIGQLFGVSDNAIRKWCDAEKLPRKASDIKKYSDEEWNEI